MDIESMQEIIARFALIFFAILLILSLIRAVRGPKVADRLVAVNMIGTMVMVMIAIMAFLQKEGYLVDICLIYAMISFLAVVVLAKVYMGVYIQHKEEEEKTEQKTANGGDGDD